MGKVKSVEDAEEMEEVEEGEFEEDTQEQKDALEDAFKKGLKEAKGKDTILPGNVVECPSCGLPNPTIRVTCEICHAKLRTMTKPKKGGKVMDEMAKELYGMNKKLKQAVTAGDDKLAKKVMGQIKVAVAKSGGVFKVGEGGLATQAKSATPKVKKERKPKVIRKCPCCGKEVGGYFAMGHDGRVHGMLIKLDLKKIKESEVTKSVLAMYNIWKRDKGQSMKTVAGKVAGN